MTKVLITTVLVPGLTCCAFGQDRYEGWCETMRGAASSDLVQFLSGVVPNEQNGHCITWAIHRLGNERYEPAITALVKLLDFRRPLMEEEKMGVFLRMAGTGEAYPAAEALEQIVKNAEPEVLQAISSDSVSATVREHAVEVWMEMHKYERPKGVALLKREEIKTTTAAVKQKLKLAVQRAVKFCDVETERADCEAAAKTGDS